MDLIEIPFHDTKIFAARDGETPMVALRPVCEATGLDYSGQLQRLRRKAWAVVGMTPTTGADGKTYEMAMLDRRTFTMWLATIDTSRLKHQATREKVELFQSEAADALDAYFHEGGAINPRASEEQLEDLHGQIISLAGSRLDMLAKARGFVSPDWLEQKFRLVIARGLGEAPEIDLDDRQLIVDDFLASKGLNRPAIRSLRSGFGQRVATEYKVANGHAPSKAPGEVGGRIRDVNFYCERDRPIFEAVWEQHYEGQFGQLILEGVTA
ncbi:P22-like antirepressor protein [Brachybacterium sp. AG952]|uniref:phage antirepressor N-terminal domain-containing protein n=1 Tax=Brachybacterium sp. AG952 TaxID=2183989 RepID=UPI0010616AD5|nr:phage antirepressor N-terminal domain-containing protein [Brachybacterium sp. AG952]TDP76309.1 P22-like antirepressor protein [Brachybacterium sp. AG952]